MKKSEIIRSKPSIQLMQERYEYWSRVPYPGLVIDNKPAITQVDIDKVGDVYKRQIKGRSRSASTSISP